MYFVHNCLQFLQLYSFTYTTYKPSHHNHSIIPLSNRHTIIILNSHNLRNICSLLSQSLFFFKKVTQHTHTPRINKSTRACLSAHIARISPCTRNERLYLKNASLEHLVNVQRSHEEVPCGSREAMTMTDYDRENEFWFARRLEPFFFFLTR